MSRILIDSSNITRFYPCDQTKDYPKYKVEAATLKRAFEVLVESIPNKSWVVVSVLENFIEREISIETGEDREKAMKKIIQSVVDTVVKAARKNKESKFVMAYPILRPRNEWMTEHEDNIKKEFEQAINAQEFEEDGVHLTLKAGRNFVGNLIGMAEDSFEAE
jgi:hypothetical protein